VNPSRMLMAGAQDIKVVGGYRTHADAMQVVSGPIHKRTVLLSEIMSTLAI
jgi:hypothetical protein